MTIAAASERREQTRITAEGFPFVELRLRRGSRNPAHDLFTLGELYLLYRRLTPDVVHHVTIKPVLYGSVAARLAGVPHVVNAVPGLGYLFIGSSWTSRARASAAMLAYRVACAGERVRFIFQNPDDRALFIGRRIAREEQTVIIRGSGVDPSVFAAAPPPGGTPVVLLPSRLLWDKGLAELIEAARELRAAGVPFRLVLAGDTDAHNPRSVNEATVRQWEREGLLEWWGHCSDMPTAMQQASIVVLPSYREGLPKALLEAGAVGRPAVTTDVPGCREVVRPGVNGLLVPPRDAPALAAALRLLLEDESARLAMGARARDIIVEHFSEAYVVRETLRLYGSLLPLRPSSHGEPA